MWSRRRYSIQTLFQMAEKYTYQPLSSDRSMRVLLLQPDSNYNSILRCSLKEKSLRVEGNAVQNYQALSYVWGAKTGSRVLVCEEKAILITPNCESALRHLRDAKREVALWIDAICINQEDLSERGKQVLLMAEIYQNAFQVIIWLGQSTPAIARCFSRMRIPAILFKYRPLKLALKCHPWIQGIFYHFFTGGMTLEERRNIYQNPWATRIWTVQESIFAAKPIVMCGHSTATFSDFLVFSTDVQTLDPAIEENEEYNLTLRRAQYSWIFRGLAQMSIRKALDERLTNGTLSMRTRCSVTMRCISLSKYSDCTEPLDKVYAIYNLLPSAIEFLPLIDYSRDKNRVIEDFTRASIEWTEKFWPASQENWYPEQTPDLASWAPDISSNHDLDLDSRWHWMQPIEDSENTTLNSKVNIRTLKQSRPGTLALKGIAYSRILGTGQRWPKVKTFSPDIFLCFIYWVTFCLQQRDPSGPYPDELIYSATMLLLLGDIGPNTSEWAVAQIISTDQWLREFATDDLLSSSVPGDSSIRPWVRNFFADKNRTAFLNNIHMRMTGYIPFSTLTRHFGKTTGSPELFDSVVLLAGCDRPVILRQEGKHWRYIGSCFIPGIEDGQAWPHDANTDEMETFVLI